MIFSKAPIIDLEKVLTVDKIGNLFLNGRPIDPKKKDNLKKEVFMFKNSVLWEILTNTLESQAYEAGWTKAKTLEDLMNAKSICYTIEVQKNIIEKIDKAR